MRNAAAILPLKSKLSEKFQRFSAINRRIEMLKLVEFSKISMKIKNYKIFCKAQTPNGLKKCINVFSPLLPPPPPSPTRTNLTTSLEQISFKEIYRNIQTFAFKVLQECVSWASRNGVMQIFFLTPHRNMFAGKFVRKVFGCFGSILFSISSEFRMSDVF